MKKTELSGDGRTVWTHAALHRLVKKRLANLRFIAVSNREPYIHQRRPDGKIECMQPASGVISALDPILRATGGTWVAHGSGDADLRVVDAQDRLAVPEEQPAYTLRRVWLDKETEERYYFGLSNQGLWPLCHAAFQRPTFRLRDWESYRQANRTFAEAVLEEAGGEPALVFIQDYHFALLPRMLKERNPNLMVAQFWHIPWPHRDVFRAFPWKDELLDGLLGNDLLGFQLQDDCANFLETVDRGLETRVDAEHGNVSRREQVTRVRPFPISIDFEQHTREADGECVAGWMKHWRAKLGPHQWLGVGIDRADYTKGIPERLAAIDRLLERHEEYRGKLVFIQVAVPSRTRIGEYQSLNEEIRSLAEGVNRRWSRNGWHPIYFCGRHLPQTELMALHRLADFCLVSSLQDGMNLVAKEFAASRSDEDGVLVLSRFTGAAQELTSALLVNPFSADQMAEAVQRALTMPAEERRRRMRSLRRVVRENNIYTWAAHLIDALSPAEFREPQALESKVAVWRTVEAGSAFA